jgi:alkylation response protein AidB-like acyl-CoA dehydrogenase
MPYDGKPKSSTPELLARLRELDRTGALSLPPPGAGSTDIRHAALFEFGRAGLSLARLAEAHTDALAIFVEAGKVVPVGQLYGVWASDGPKSWLTVKRMPGGKIGVNGTKKYCSGAQLLDAALVSAHEADCASSAESSEATAENATQGTATPDSRETADHVVLLNMPLSTPGLTIDASEWVAPAFSGTATASVTFDNVELNVTDIIGPADWYLTRPGFWHGALGPAACWAGGAVGLVDAARASKKRDPHARAQLGALEAAEWGLRALVVQAAREIDADPLDTSDEARRRALMVRHLVERMCTDVLDRFGRATGPQLLAFDGQIAQRHAELSLYIRQCHAERDLSTIPR